MPPSIRTEALPVQASAGELSLAGNAEPGRLVRVLLDGLAVYTSTVDMDGTWQAQLRLPAAGKYRVDVELVDEEGSVQFATTTGTCLSKSCYAPTTSLTQYSSYGLMAPAPLLQL